MLGQVPRAAEMMQVPELIGGASGLGWVAVKAVLLFTVAVIGLRHAAGYRRAPQARRAQRLQKVNTRRTQPTCRPGGGDTENVNRDRAEAHLRLLAEEELRRATLPLRSE